MSLVAMPKRIRSAHVAQLVEHVLGKDEVTGSIPVVGSTDRAAGMPGSKRFWSAGK